MRARKGGGVRRVIPVLCMFAAGACAPRNASEELAALFHDDWEFQLRENPLFATQVGDHRYNDRLPSVTPADYQRRLAREREFLKRLEAIDRSALGPAEQVSYDIFARLKRDAIAEYGFRSYFLPFTTFSSFFGDFPELPRRVPLRTVQDYENYLARLAGFQAWVREYIQLMGAGLREGYSLPRVALEGVERTLEAQIVENPEESPLFEAFRQFPLAVPEAQRPRLAARGREAILGSVVPGYREFLRFMIEEYLPAARTEIAASALPNGRAFYEHRVRSFTTVETTPEEVHRLGLEEVARIRREMEAVMERVGFRGGLRAFMERLRTDRRFYVDSPDRLLKEAAYIAKRMDGELPRLFKTLPRMTYGIRPIPDYIAPKLTSAYYSEPAGDGTRAGFYYVNTYNLAARPLYELEALTLHEAVPGHHLQIARQQELGELPPFRRFTGFTAFTEGWALYAERLGLEVGFYQDPYSEFGRLTFEMWRACRLVVDTGIHAFGWTRPQAIDYMAENTALSLHNIAAEVDRYITWPGQALAYKVGELKFRELRARAERELGPRFDLREFHDVVLGSGAVPLEILVRNVEAWIAGARAAVPGS